MQSLIGQKRWVLESPPTSLVERLRSQIGGSLTLARLLALRARDQNPCSFLENDLASLSSPWAMKGISEAVERIAYALRNGERIFIHGDFDVDGLTSSALLYRALRELDQELRQSSHPQIKIKVEIGDRQRGHGLNDQVAERIHSEDFQLLITSDCGSSDIKPIERLQRAGVDVIVTDHHQTPETLPPAFALINPQQPGCSYPRSHLAAVGVIYQLVRALYEHLRLDARRCERFLDLVMFGTVADLVPLIRDGQAENKILVANGLRQLARGEGTLGLRVLLDKLALDPAKLTSGDLGYIVAPKLNAANRVGDPRVAFLLLTTEQRQRAEYLAEILLDYNQDRRLAQEELRDQAQALVEAELDLQRDRIIILSGQDWDPGVIGLVASDLVDRYYLPTILIAQGDELSRGSGRSIREFNLVEALTYVQHLFERYGGHQMAAGFSIHNEKISVLKEELGTYARTALADLAGPTYSIDAMLQSEEIDLGLYEEIKRLAPFGVGNPAPRFCLSEAHIAEASVVGAEERHLKMLLEVGERQFAAIGFNMGAHLSQIYGVKRVSPVFKLSRNDWGGRSRVELELEDLLACEPL